MRIWFGIIKNKLKKVLVYNQNKVIKEGSLNLDQKEWDRLEKALKCYLFCRQKSRENCPAEIQERLIHAGHIAFSLVVAFIEEREFKMEYMEFLNDELAAYCSMQAELKMLTIPPTQIDELKLRQNAKFRFSDAESGKLFNLQLDSENKSIQFKVEQVDRRLKTSDNSE